MDKNLTKCKLIGIDANDINNELEHGNISYRSHSIYDLKIYKYTQQCTFGGHWNPITSMCRGLVLNSNMEVVANCIPKFFNYEEYARYTNIDINQPFTVTDKSDGSLIQVFMYNGNMIVSSSGAFENEYTLKAEQLLNTKYQHLLPIIQATDRMNFIFELIAPLTKVVVSYGDLEELRLITVRDDEGLEYDDYIQQCKDLGFDYVNVLDFKDVDDVISKKKGVFENAEGFVVKFLDGSRIKFKYDEYFVIHKTLSHVNKRFVWDALSAGNELKLENIPDESFDEIKAWESELLEEYHVIELICQELFDKIMSMQLPSRKDIAMIIQKEYLEYSNILFYMLDNRDTASLIWKKIKP